MIKIEQTEIFGWESAIRGMRNPLNSWNKSDSGWDGFGECNGYSIGETDLSLMKKLVSAGADHSKFMRMLTVYCDITAPLYWWKEYDTYKVGTVANSCSTMHKIHDKEFELDDFSCEHLYGAALQALVFTIGTLNMYRDAYNDGKLKEDWWQMIQLLPASYNQRRTVQLNYAVLRNMYRSRKNHKLDEWHTFCEWVETLPHAKELICETQKGE